MAKTDKALKSTPEELAYGRVYSRGYGAAEKKYKDIIAELDAELAMATKRHELATKLVKSEYEGQYERMSRECSKERMFAFRAGIFLGAILFWGFYAIFTAVLGG